MPIVLTWPYVIAVTLAIGMALACNRVRFPALLRGPLCTITILGTLWLLGRHPLGFLVSIGGWLMLIITLVLGWIIPAIFSSYADKAT